MRKYVIAALLAGSVAAPTFAQDATPFSGFRLEGLVGYDQLGTGDRNGRGVENDDQRDESIEGAVFGVGAGYDFNLGSAVVGVEAEFSESTGEQDRGETINGVNFTSGIETGRDLYIGGRVGFPVAPTTLVYGKLGYTNTSVEARSEGGGDRFELDTNVDGYRIGAGVEQLLGPNSFAKLEYRYSNYNNLDFSDDFDFDSLRSEDFNRDIDLDRHQVMVGLGFRF